LASKNKMTSAETAANCSDVASYGGLALDGSLPVRGAFEIGKHLRSCAHCTNYVDQVAKTRALLGLRADAPAARKTHTERHQQASDPGGKPGLSPAVLAQTQDYLMTLGRATDPAHADDLVQDTWDHFLGGSSTAVPDRARLAAYLIQHAQDHLGQEQTDRQAWADDLVRHHPHNHADLAETDLPAEPGGHGDWRTLADFDALDPDADQAELYLPDLYGDGPDQVGWSTPPARWPSVTRMLRPDEEVQTSELYSVVDSALDGLPAPLADVLYLVDIEGHSLGTASSLLGRDTASLQHDLAQARDHVRSRVNAYLTSR
jgi:DNA-directed RNA polymerase specialized sigma24 family protein